jgi:hypothetical protein
MLFLSAGRDEVVVVDRREPLGNVEKLLERIAQRLEREAPEGHPPGV